MIFKRFGANLIGFAILAALLKLQATYNKKHETKHWLDPWFFLLAVVADAVILLYWNID
ncbi:hypothetical protein [Periweissella cryptocerci]|uniref:hypothetical protein n=1 Tax=Periweissella cryptocerci TaxID=2506420 RepID=UPI001404FA93|nr:hypothetical protein [Periweissella cryptocerci]